MATTERPSARFRSSFPTAPLLRPSERLRVFSATAQPTNLIELLARTAARDDGEKRGFTILPEVEGGALQFLSYRALYSELPRLAVALRQQGVSPGDPVLLLLPTGVDFLRAFFAVQAAGAIAVPSYPPATLERVDRAFERLRLVQEQARAKTCILTDEYAELVKAGRGQLGPGTRLVTLRDLEVADESRRASPASMVPNRIAFLQYTSGSTGVPKGVMVTGSAACANIDAAVARAKPTEDDRLLSWLPMYHDFGLMAPLTMMSVGGSVFLLPTTAFVLQPRRWLSAISEHRITISSSPNFGYALAVRRIPAAAREGLDLSHWRIAMNGAEPVNVETIRAFADAYAPHGLRSTAMYPSYGLAESVVAVALPEPGAKLRVERVSRAALATGYVEPGEGRDAIEVVSVGRVLDGHDLQILDDHGDPVPDGRVGHIAVSGPSVTPGYFGNSAQTARVFRDGWLWTGDLGYVRGGELFVTGRVNDLIILFGKNYYAEDIERAVEGVAGVRGGGAIVFGLYDDDDAIERVVVVAESLNGSDSSALPDAIAKAVAVECGIKVHHVLPIPAGMLPKTSSGKKMRGFAKAKYVEMMGNGELGAES